MFSSRRQLLLCVPVVLGTVYLSPNPLLAQEDSMPVNPPRVTQPKNPPEPDPATRALLAKQNRKAIKKEVERLFDLATQLKTEVGKPESVNVLSLSLIKKAEEIEKLAKQIKGQAKNLLF